MGVPGLFDALKPISRPIQLPELNGLVLGVDGYGWLHRSTFSCAEELLAGTRTAKYLNYFERRIALFASCGVSLYFVFDGQDLPIKERVNLKRAAARAQAQRQLSAGSSNTEKKRALNVTCEMAAGACRYLKAKNIPFVVAPFEADAQLVWLEKNGIVDAILSEDSDLFIFGAQKLVAKLQDYSATLVDFTQAHNVPLIRPVASSELMRALAILSGCDYSPGVPGIGVIKAAKLLAQAGSLDAAMATLGTQLPAGFEAVGAQANQCFQFQRIWNPLAKKLECLDDPCGEQVDDIVIGPPGHTLRMASGLDHPTTGMPFELASCFTDFIMHCSPVAVKVVREKDYRQRAHRLFTSPPAASRSPFFKSRAASSPLANKENIPGKLAAPLAGPVHRSTSVPKLDFDRTPLAVLSTNSLVAGSSKANAARQPTLEEPAKKPRLSLSHFKYARA